VSMTDDWEKRCVGAPEGLGEIERRTFVKLSGLSAAALIFGLGPFTEEAVARPRFSDYPFSLGVASGDPRPHGVVLWTRLAPDPLAEDGNGGMPPLKVPVYWEIAEDEGFGKVVQSGEVFARPELAHSVHVIVRGLNPTHEYFYRFTAGSELSPIGRTKTAPAPGASVAELAFGFASCQMYEHGYYTAYRRMSEEDFDLVVHPATTSTSTARTSTSPRAATSVPITARRSSRSPNTATATPSTKRTRISKRRTRPSLGSSPGTTTRWRTTMPTRSPK
jgi:hypothetical protein